METFCTSPDGGEPPWGTSRFPRFKVGPLLGSKNGLLMLREVCFLIGKDDVVQWSDASHSPTALPDSRARWQAIWSRRDRIVEVAHTHPLGGAKFSLEDETTMAALDAALGRRLRYAVVTPTQLLRRIPGEPAELSEQAGDHIVETEPWWTTLIRSASGLTLSVKGD